MLSKFKPAQPGDTRPRCQHPVRRNGYNKVHCGRLAKTYEAVYQEKVIATATLCRHHQAQLASLDLFTMRRVDGRKKKAEVV